VTDDMDRRALMSLLRMVYAPDTLRPGAPLSSSSSEFVTPPAGVHEYADYVSFIGTLPTNASCGVFGLHGNAAITRDIQTAYDLLDAALLMTGSVTYKTAGADEEEGGGEGAGSPRASAAAAPASGAASGERPTSAAAGGAGGSGGGGHAVAKSRDETILELASDILARLPADFDLEGVEIRFPNDPRESMNTVLVQELARYNRLLALIRSSMKDVQAAMKGLIVLSSALEAVATDLSLGRVPALWRERSYPTRKPLASYVADLLRRLGMFESWIAAGRTPSSFWLPGFFFTQSFLTGVSQNFARKYVIPIDELAFDMRMLPIRPEHVGNTPPPADGAHVWGPYLDGCQWDYAGEKLGESAPGVLFSAAPVMWLLPVRAAELRSFPNYVCPLYRTTERRGVLSTTGHSTNHVTNIRVPSDKPSDWWVRRGVAMVLALDD